MKESVMLWGILALGLVVCSKAPTVDFPEPTNRVVLAEFMTEEG